MSKNSDKVTSPSSNSASLPPLTPPPFLKALESYLGETKDSPKASDSNSVPSEQCYRVSEATNKDVKCYELPSKEFSSPEGSRVKRKRDEGVYECKPLDLVTHQKKLAALKSLENVNPEALEEGELEKSIESPCKEKASTEVGLKRSRSVANLDVEEGEFTPKRVAREDTRYRNIFESPSNDFFRHRKSLPCPTEPSLPFSGRKSFPALSPYHRNRADQTPYASPLYPQRRRFFTYDASSLQSLESEAGFVDSHCHLDFLFDRQGYRGTWTQFREEMGFPRCYKGCLAIFCNPFSFGKAYKWRPFLEEDNVWASFGCHPHNAKDYNDDIEKDLCAALEHSKVRALGEIGLDYSNRNNCMKDKQFSAFRRQLKIAFQKKLPVVIHCREAHEDGISIVKEVLPLDYPIHLHCFTDTWATCEQWLSTFCNLCVGLTSVLSFPSAEDVRGVARELPLSRLLLETDAPYFIPRASTVARGTKHSHPGMAIHVAAQVAAIKDVPIEQVLRAARANTKRIYNI